MAWKYSLVVLRAIVGAVFLVSGFAKLLLPREEFAEILLGYQIIPLILVGPISVLLPGIELLTGSFLMAGLFTRWASLAIVVQLIGFIGLMTVVLISGIELEDCGCFGNLGFRETPAQVLLRDLVLLAMALPLFLTKNHRVSLDNLLDAGKNQ